MLSDKDNLSICIDVHNEEYYYVDFCKENLDLLANINNVHSDFLLFKDTYEIENGLLGIKRSEIIAFYVESRSVDNESCK